MSDIRKVLSEVLMEADRELYEAECGKGEHIFSERFEKAFARNALRFFKNGKYIGRKRRLIGTYTRVAAVACALVLCIGIAFNAKAIGDLLVRWVVSLGDASTNIMFEVPEGVDVPNTIESKYYLSKVPEGYSLFGSNESPFYNTETYVDEKNNHLVISQYCYHYIKTVLDTEAAEVNEAVVMGNKGYIVKKENSLRIIWENGEYCFVIHSTYGFTEEDLVELASFVIEK